MNLKTLLEHNGVGNTSLHKAFSTLSAYLATDPDREGEAIAWHVV
ncbi:toprim domain-containing protein, partial [Anaplasma platys]